MHNYMIRSCCVLLVLLVTAAGTLASADPKRQAEAGQAYRDAYGLIIDSNWTGAIEAFQGLIQRFPSSDWVDDARFWICYATEKTNPSADNSFSCYESFLKENPKSEWANDAKMNMVRIANQLVREGKTEYEQKVRRFGNRNEDEVVLLVLMALLDKGNSEVIDKVIERLDQTENEEIRAKITRMLDDHAENQVVFDKLAQLARTDASVKVRRSAVRALSEVDSPRTIEILKQIVAGDVEVEVRRTALRELGDMESHAEDVIPYLSQVAQTAADDNMAYAAIDAIGEFEGPQSLESLLGLYSSVNNPKRRRMVIRTLEDRDEDARAVMEFLLKVVSAEGDIEVRRTAVASIGELEIPEAFVKVAEIAESNLDREVREAAVRTLGEFQTEEAVQVLSRVLKSEQDVELRIMAADSLGETEQDSAVAPLAEAATSDPNSGVKRAAIRALGEIGTPAAQAALLKLLEPNEED